MSVEISLWDERPLFFVNDELPDAAIDTLDKELRYEVPDAKYTDAWKDGEWDGFHRLFRKAQSGSYFFPIGLLHKVRNVLDMLGIDYHVEGLTYPGKGDIQYAWDTDMTLRDYQREAADEAILNGQGLIVLPTGSGKTLIGLRLIKELQHSAAVFVHRQEIAEQWAQKIEDILDVDVARNYGGDRENGDVMVALYQSVYDDDTGDVREDVRLDHEVAVFDEAHNVAADTFSKVALEESATFRFGFTATPDREDNATLRVVGGTGPAIANLSVERLIDEGYLAEPEFQMIEAPSVGGSYRQWQDEYEKEIVENMRRNKTIAQKVRELEKPCLVSVERVNHGEHLEALLDDSKFVHGSKSDRPELIQAFRDGEIDVLIATRGIVGEGFDVPEIASFVVAGGMKSSTSMIQQVGRALRPGTEKAQIVDFWDRGQWVSEHSERRVRTYQDYYGSYGP